MSLSPQAQGEEPPGGQGRCPSPSPGGSCAGPLGHCLKPFFVPLTDSLETLVRSKLKCQSDLFISIFPTFWLEDQQQEDTEHKKHKIYTGDKQKTCGPQSHLFGPPISRYSVSGITKRNYKNYSLIFSNLDDSL